MTCDSFSILTHCLGGINALEMERTGKRWGGTQTIVKSTR